MIADISTAPLVIFEDVDAGIVLLELPEAADAHAEEVADDDLIYCIVRCDEDGFPVILFCIFVKSSADTFPDIFQAFAFRHLYFFRMGMPKRDRISDTWLRSHPAWMAFPKTVTDFCQPFVLFYDKAMLLSRHPACFIGTGEGDWK